MLRCGVHRAPQHLARRLLQHRQQLTAHLHGTEEQVYTHQGMMHMHGETV
jgi:hypothetical protein